MAQLLPRTERLTGAWNAIASQLLAAQGDLLRLMEDAKAQGSENLQRMGRQAGPKLDASLRAPSSMTPLRLPSPSL
jgi:hypothetical protein